MTQIKSDDTAARVARSLIGNRVWDVALRILAIEDVRLAHVFDGAKVTYFDNFTAVQIITADPAARALSPPVVQAMFRQAFEEVVPDLWAQHYEDVNWPKVSVDSPDLLDGQDVFDAQGIEEEDPVDQEDVQAELAAIAAAPQPEKAILRLYCPVADRVCDREDDCRRGQYCARMAQPRGRATSQIQSNLQDPAAPVPLPPERTPEEVKARMTLRSLQVIRDALKASLDVMDREIEKLEGK